jgi:hypothetical protein
MLFCTTLVSISVTCYIHKDDCFHGCNNSEVSHQYENNNEHVITL